MANAQKKMNEDENTINSSGKNRIEMADALRKSGKIYIVVAVLVIILTGMIIYQISIDRKVRKLEKEIRTEKEEYTT